MLMVFIFKLRLRLVSLQERNVVLLSVAKGTSSQLADITTTVRAYPEIPRYIGVQIIEQKEEEINVDMRATGTCDPERRVHREVRIDIFFCITV